ncbi:MAG TPA: NAD(+)/NADH kinase [Candidatus Dormibacteraeota bacterium]
MTAKRRSIGFLLHPRERHRPEVLEPAVSRATAAGYEVWMDTGDAESAVAEHADSTALLVTVGGDGTFLLGARLAAPRGIPVLGVNRGQLGFLTDIDLADLPDAVDCFVQGRHRAERRSLLELELLDGVARHPSDLALNEVVVKSTGMNLARLRVEVDGELFGEFDADGVIIATATGSTAYALSSGGPLVDPRVRAVVVVPLAPHAVITRAVVLPEAVTVQVTVQRGRTFAAADGHLEVPLREGGGVVVRPGPELHVVVVAGSPTFLRRLREKLRFGMPLKHTLDEPDGRRVRRTSKET